MDHDSEAQAGAQDEDLRAARRQQEQAFYESCGTVPSYELADFEPWLGQPFTLEGPDGLIPEPITLDEIEKKPTLELKRRKTVRKHPFLMEFVGPDKVLLPDSLYKLRPLSKPELSFLLFINTIDHIREDGIYVYQAVVN